MPKRLRNGLGKFITNYSSDFEPINQLNFIAKKILKILYIIGFFLLISPWISLSIKSQNIRTLIYAIIHFYDSHFLGIEEDISKSKEENNGGYFSFK